MDLACSNPTRQGVVHEPERIRDWLSDAARYAPDPKGLPIAREAVCAYLRRHRSSGRPEHVIVGSGTSELYAQLMAVLSDPGDVWLVPQPGYPLFDYIADLFGIRLKPYLMAFDGRWHIREADLRAAVADEPSAKALVAISPHNPTGHVCTETERRNLHAVAHAYGLTLIVDEVFLDYPLHIDGPLPSWPADARLLTCTLSGLSKVAAFPQGKLAWMHINGPSAVVEECIARAEVIADTFLSASTIVQAGLGAILRDAPAIQNHIRARCRRNLYALKEALADTAVTVLEPDAGWSALLRFPNTRSDEAWAERLLREHSIVTQPGYLFGLDIVSDAPFLSVSLLIEPDAFDRGVDAIRAAPKKS